MASKGSFATGGRRLRRIICRVLPGADPVGPADNQLKLCSTLLKSFCSDLFPASRSAVAEDSEMDARPKASRRQSIGQWVYHRGINSKCCQVVWDETQIGCNNVHGHGWIHHARP